MNPLNQFNLSGKKALITGSSQGIGYALANGLAGAGASVILNGTNEEKLSSAAKRLRSQGFNVDELPCDVTDPQAIKQAIDGYESSNGEIDILINNAGMQHRTTLEQFPVDKFDQLMHLNINAVFYVSQAVAQHMIKRGKGKIVNICSVQSALARPSIAPYTASKGAVVNLTKGMATDWAKHGLNINGLAPGYFKTELTEALVNDKEFTQWLENRTPAGRWGDVEELVGSTIFLCSEASTFVNGQVIYVDGGITACL